MTDTLDRLPAAAQQKIRRARPPASFEPMLATLTDDRFSDANWIFERKLDGERAIARRADGGVRLLSRNGKDLGASYPELVEALEAQSAESFIADGEIVAFDGKVTSFSRLQRRMQVKDPDKARRSGVAVFFYLFDLPYLGGCSLEAVPLRARKAALKDAMRFEGPLRYTPHRNETGEDYYENACEKGWEGVIAKRAGAPYRHGRSRDWLKFKCAKGQELVIGGFTEPNGSRKGFGALLVGYYDDGGLRYAGKVGTGFDDALLVDLRKRMDAIARKSAPFDDPPSGKDVTWISPKLVGEFGFTEWTRDGKLRHPRFLGLRRDKSARDVVRERGEN